MNSSSFLLVTLNFVIIGVVPFLTMRRGRLTPGLVLTLAPMAIAPVLVVAAWSGVFPVDQPWLLSAREVLLAVAALVSITLVAYTAGTHRIPLSLWHQRDDAPVEIVNWGPYRRVRHPFYASYLLALVAAVLLIPGWPAVAVLVIGALALHLTARGEERRLLASDLGAQYAAYREQTGQFVPRLRPARRSVV
jgi:protein-S-isoprenylcysteine O-methyltransferase Ste14